MCYKVLNYKKEHVFQENGGGECVATWGVVCTHKMPSTALQFIMVFI